MLRFQGRKIRQPVTCRITYTRTPDLHCLGCGYNLAETELWYRESRLCLGLNSTYASAKWLSEDGSASTLT